MKRLEVILIAICLFTLASACGKKDKVNGRTTNEPNVEQDLYYPQTNCSEQMIYQYQELNYVCSNAYTWYEHRDCDYLIEEFMNQYPQINCRNESRYHKSRGQRGNRHSKVTSITTQDLQNKSKLPK